MSERNIQIALPATGEEEWQALREPVLTGWLTQGPKVEAFEKAFAQKHQVRHAIATTSCTTGLHLTLSAMGVGQGDEVIVPAFTWVATANVVIHCGATPVFVDVDPQTYNMDPALVAAKVTPRTRAIIPVHLFGLCANVDAISESLPDHVKIVEDAACAAGAAYKGCFAGSLGYAGVFSLHPRKIITTGEGGMITTNDDQLAERMVQMRNHGASVSEEERHKGPKPYILPEFNLLGFNYRMTDLQGAVGLVQLGKLDGFIDERVKRASYYRENLGNLGWLRLPDVPETDRPGWQSFVVWVDGGNAPMSRNQMMETLAAKGISTRPGTQAVHMLQYHRDRFGLKPDDFPCARDCYQQTLALPLHNRMSEADTEYVVDSIKNLGT
jgi:dTDP-4-amino-4,6-dideoxygalactose transaminase